ncbi:MAG: lipoyl(octanoyl) transferase LipB [Candidatus Eisenbacteria bacterium]|uniref:Octanoyltransferase n=1 Tax=Eiseniibacteriota bacterium TaxID=2212470 RepID=A0A933W7K7_UNCEI|nr:lipoyl(octanoyl) transferase LipB [Candidatus Eisenbacteria bacterium]
MPGRLTVCALGATSYREGLALQDALVHARAAGDTGDWLVYPDHPPVLTAGRSTGADSLLVDRATLERLGVELFEVPRGGDVTWHGPGQLVGYPIVGLDRVGRDLHKYLRLIEEALIRAMARYGIVAARSEGRTGVWVGERKLASIGVAVRRWVGYHGFALNVCPDLAGFSLIHPCGLKGVEMTSMAELLGPAAPTLEEVREVVTQELASQLGFEQVTPAAPETLHALLRDASRAEDIAT